MLIICVIFIKYSLQVHACIKASQGTWHALYSGIVCYCLWCGCSMLVSFVVYVRAGWIYHVLLLILQSCKHESWTSIAKFLMDDVPFLLKSEDVKDIHKVLSIIFTSLPSNFEEFIQWVAEIRRREDGGSSLSTEEKARLSVKV